MNDKKVKPLREVPLEAALARLQANYGMSESPDLTTSLSTKSSLRGIYSPKTMPRMRALRNVWQRKWLDLEVTHPELQVMADGVQTWMTAFVKRDTQQPRLFVLVGPVCVGKSHVAKKMRLLATRIQWGCKDCAWERPPRVDWVEFAKVAFLEAREFERWMERYTDAPVDLIFLEDVGSEIDRFKTGEPIERLREILNEFENRWLFVTTNVLPELWQHTWDVRVASRLLRRSSVILLRETRPFSGNNGADLAGMRTCNS